MEQVKKIKILRAFHGYVSPRDYQVADAILKHQDLLIILEETGEEMLIPYDQLKTGRKDNFCHRSKHGSRPYYLIDYLFKPTSKQIKLI